MLMMRAFWGTQKIGKTPPRAGRGAPRVLMMLASWPPRVVHGGPETRHSLGMAAKRVRVPRGLRARSRAAQWKRVR